MPITAEEILQHREFHGVKKAIQDMDLSEYADALHRESIVFVESHGFLIDSLSGRPFAADGEQLTLLIQHLEKLRSALPEQNLEQLLKR